MGCRKLGTKYLFVSYKEKRYKESDCEADTMKQIQEFRWLYFQKLECARDTVLSTLLKPEHYDLVSRV